MYWRSLGIKIKKLLFPYKGLSFVVLHSGRAATVQYFTQNTGLSECRLTNQLCDKLKWSAAVFQ